MIEKVCVTLTPEQMIYIKSLPGVSFSEKLRSIIERDRALHHSSDLRSNSEIGNIIDKYPQLSIFD